MQTTKMCEVVVNNVNNSNNSKTYACFGYTDLICSNWTRDTWDASIIRHGTWTTFWNTIVILKKTSQNIS